MLYNLKREIHRTRSRLAKKRNIHKRKTKYFSYLKQKQNIFLNVKCFRYVLLTEKASSFILRKWKQALNQKFY